MFLAFPVHGVLWPQAMLTAITLVSRGATFGMHGGPWLDQVRSELVGLFRETKEELCLFQDADVWFDASLVDSMIEAGSDVITCSYRKREPPHEYVARALGRTHPKDAPTRSLAGGRRVVEIARDGLGCCLVRRRVVETLYEKHVDLRYLSDAGQWRCNLFEYGIRTDAQGVRRAGAEDRAFFERVRAAGFKVECLADATVMHGGIPGRFSEVLDEGSAGIIAPGQGAR